MKKSYLMILAVVLLALGVSMVQAGNPMKSRSIVAVERNSQNVPQALYVNIDVDHKDRIYRENDLMNVTVTASKTCYLYLFYKNAANEITMLFPNKFESNNKIEGGKTLVLPTQAMNFEFRTQKPFGNELLQAIVTLQPVKDLETIAFKSAATSKSISQEDIKSLENCFLGMGVIGTSQKPQEQKPQEQKPQEQKPQQVRNDFADCTIAITTLPQKAEVPVAKSKRVFIGIGVSEYVDKRIVPLPACENDLKEMGKLMVELCHADPDLSKLYLNKDVTYNKIKELFFDYLPSVTNPGDEIIIFWTGHGARCADTNGDEKDGYDETLVLYDSNRTEPTTQLIDDDFGRWVQNISGRKILFILDTCHSFGMNNTAKGLDDDFVNLPWDFGFGEVMIMKDLGQREMSVIASSAASELSMVRPDQKMSVMTWFIIDYLKKNRGVSHTGLAKAIGPQVESFVHEIEPSISQTVGLQDELSEPMILNK